MKTNIYYASLILSCPGLSCFVLPVLLSCKSCPRTGFTGQKHRKDKAGQAGTGQNKTSVIYIRFHAKLEKINKENMKSCKKVSYKIISFRVEENVLNDLSEIFQI